MSGKTVKRIIAALLAAALLPAAGCRSQKKAVSAPSVCGETVLRHRRFLSECGWRLSDAPPTVTPTRLPAADTPVFGVYNELQKKQGFDLTPYAGRRVLRYSYEVTANGKGEPMTDVYANVLECHDRMIGGDVGSVRSDGFMFGFHGERNENDTFG